MKRIEEETGGLKVRPAAQPRALDGALMPLPVEPSSYHFERVSEAEWLVMGYLAPPIASKDYAAMKVLDSIMGGSMNSRLFTELRDKKGLAYQVGSMYPSRLGPSIFATYIGASPENHDGVVAGILEEVERIKNEPVPEEELERAKTYIKGTFIMSQESNMGQASLYGTYEMLGVGYQFVDQYPALIGEVTAEKVQQAARAYLNFYTLTTISPKAGTLDKSVEKTSGRDSQD
jgi:predicted Zn-dependent peptidase